MRKFFHILFIFITSCFFSLQAQKKEDKDYLYLLYQNYYTFSEFNKAEKILKKLISLYPEEKYIEEYINFLYFLKKYPQVITTYKKYKRKLSFSKRLLTYLIASALILKDEKTYNELKNYFLSLMPLEEKDAIFLINMEILKGDKRKALEILNSLEKHFKHSEKIEKLRGEILIEMGKYKEGIGIIESLPSKDDRDFLLLARAYEYLRDYDKALFYFLKADSIRRDDPVVKRNIVDVLIEKSDFKKADSITDILLKMNPLNPEYLRLKGYLQYELKDYPSAMKNLLLALEVNPKDDLSNYYLSRVYYRLGKYENSLKYIEKALEINSKAVEYLNYKIFLLIVKKDYRHAFYELRRILRRYPEDPGINYLAGFLFSETGRKKTAIKFYLKSLRYDSLSPQKWFELGALYESLNMVEKAEECFKKVIRLDSLNASAYNYWGYMLAERGVKLKLAMKLIEKALEISPGNGYYLDSLGWVYYQMGDYEKAKEILFQAVQIEPDDPVILEHYGDVLFKLGDIERAKEMYKKAFKFDPQNKRLLKKIGK